MGGVLYFDGKLPHHNSLFCEMAIKITLYALLMVAQVGLASPGLLCCSSWVVKYNLMRCWHEQ